MVCRCCGETFCKLEEESRREARERLAARFEPPLTEQEQKDEAELVAASAAIPFAPRLIARNERPPEPVRRLTVAERIARWRAPFVVACVRAHYAGQGVAWEPGATYANTYTIEEARHIAGLLNAEEPDAWEVREEGVDE